jgi:hypothetical protein
MTSEAQDERTTNNSQFYDSNPIENEEAKIQFREELKQCMDLESTIIENVSDEKLKESLLNKCDKIYDICMLTGSEMEQLCFIVNSAISICKSSYERRLKDETEFLKKRYDSVKEKRVSRPTIIKNRRNEASNLAIKTNRKPIVIRSRSLEMNQRNLPVPRPRSKIQKEKKDKNEDESEELERFKRMNMKVREERRRRREEEKKSKIDNEDILESEKSEVIEETSLKGKDSKAKMVTKFNKDEMRFERVKKDENIGSKQVRFEGKSLDEIMKTIKEAKEKEKVIIDQDPPTSKQGFFQKLGFF